MSERTKIYEREKLYEEVWKEPVLVVADRYGVSNVALAKACRKLAVPLPPRGYWARIKGRTKATHVSAPAALRELGGKSNYPSGIGKRWYDSEQGHRRKS